VTSTGNRRAARIATALVATAVAGTAAVVAVGSGEGGTGAAGGAAADGPVTTALRTVDFPAADGRSVAIPRRDTAVFAMVGVTWTDPKIDFRGTVSVRTRAVGGGWSDWLPLELDNHFGPEPGAEATSGKARGSTDPLWVGYSDAVEVRAAAGGRSSDRLPAGLRLELVDPGRPKRPKAGAAGAGRVGFRPVAAMRTAEPTPTGTVPADATTSEPVPAGSATSAAPSEPTAPAPTETATTTAPPETSAPITSAPAPPTGSPRASAGSTTAANPVTAPDVVTRAGWKADESIVREPPAYGTTVKAFFVHHTAGTNTYSCADSAAVVRGIQVYHVKSNGWNDIGYNFLVDKCGVVFEGRKGGIDQPVTGAHTYGFNTDTAAIAVLGTYVSAGAPTAVQDAVAHVAAYKLGRYGNDPAGTVTLVSGVDGKYDLGESVVMNRISGHRDGVATECPGDALYAQLGAVRSRAAAISGLALTGLNAGRSGTTYYTRGSFIATWSVGTSTALVDRFEVLVDGRVAATVPGTARSAGVTVRPGTHTVQIRAVHSSGPTVTTAAQTVVGDMTLPTFRSTPSLALRTGTVDATGVPATLSWRATDNAALRAAYLTAPSALTFGPATSSSPVTARPGAATAWSMRALDWAGNATTSTASRTTVLTAETSATRSTGWATTTSSSYLGGSALTSTTRNASLKWTVTGRSVAFIARRSSTSGQVALYVDGVKVATVDLRSSTTENRQAVWTRTWSSSGTHTVTAVVVGTSGRPRVTADGIAVVR
jgi:uncharacterized protein with LGFP repeats